MARALNDVTRLWDSSDDNMKELASGLAAFGLSRSQALLYIWLLKLGPSTTPTIADRLSLPRTETYHHMSALSNFGLVEKGLGVPAAYHPVEPNEALDALISLKNIEMDNLLKNRGVLVEGLTKTAINRDPTQEESELIHFTQLSGRNGIENKIVLMLREAKDEVCVLADTEHVMKMYHSSVSDRIKNFVIDGGVCRLLVSSSEKSVTRYVSEGFGAVDARTFVQPFSGFFILERNVQVVMSAMQRALRDESGGREWAVHTNAAHIVNNQLQTFELLWQNAKPLLANGKKISVANRV